MESIHRAKIPLKKNIRGITRSTSSEKIKGKALFSKVKKYFSFINNEPKIKKISFFMAIAAYLIGEASWDKIDEKKKTKNFLKLIIQDYFNEETKQKINTDCHDFLNRIGINCRCGEHNCKLKNELVKYLEKLSTKSTCSSENRISYICIKKLARKSFASVAKSVLINSKGSMVTTNSFLRSINSKLLGEGKWQEINKMKTDDLEKTIKEYYLKESNELNELEESKNKSKYPKVSQIVKKIRSDCHYYLQKEFSITCSCKINPCIAQDNIDYYLKIILEIPDQGIDMDQDPDQEFNTDDFINSD